MRFVFAKDYNPAYDFFLFKYFREGGINIDEKTTNRRANDLKLSLEGQPSVTPAEKLFCIYVRLWNAHPDARPSNYSLLENIPANQGRLDAERFKELQSGSLYDGGALLFSELEVSETILSFHRRHLAEWLSADIKNGAPSSRLMRYMTSEEINGMPNPRNGGDSRTLEEATKNNAMRIMTWLRATSLEKVGRDIRDVLEEHEAARPSHMKRTFGSASKREGAICEHTVEYVSLMVSGRAEDGPVSIYIYPSRGFGAIKQHEWELFFPKFVALGM